MKIFLNKTLRSITCMILAMIILCMMPVMISAAGVEESIEPQAMILEYEWSTNERVSYKGGWCYVTFKADIMENAQNGQLVSISNIRSYMDGQYVALRWSENSVNIVERTFYSATVEFNATVEYSGSVMGIPVGDITQMTKTFTISVRQ